MEAKSGFCMVHRNAVVKQFPFLEERNADQVEYLECIVEYMDQNIELSLDGK